MDSNNTNAKRKTMNAITQRVEKGGKVYLANATHLVQVFVDGHRKTCGITGQKVVCCGYWKTLRKPIARCNG